MAKKKKSTVFDDLFDFAEDNIAVESEEEQAIKELIHRRRRQMLVHSFIYYRLYENVVPDDTWQAWANELSDLQDKHPKWSKINFYDEEFSDWTGDSGAFLPLGHPWIAGVAYRILEFNGQKRNFRKTII